MKIRVIVNPKAGAGAAERKIPSVVRALRNAAVTHDVAETRAPRHATELARQARLDGVDVIAVIGGDGTLNEVGQAYLDDGGDPVPGPALGLIPAGTGGDFRRALAVDRDSEAAVRRLLSGHSRPLDLGVVDLTGDRGEPIRRAFVNIASFGVSGSIDRLVNRSPKWMGGRVAFAIGTVRAMSTYRNAPVSIQVDGKPFYEGRIVVVAIANGQFFGGGMHVAPKADVGDGLFDVVVIGDKTFTESLRDSSALYAGKHLDTPKVEWTRGSRVEAIPLETNPVYVDTDGESPGRLPLQARVLPGALEFLG